MLFVRFGRRYAFAGSLTVIKNTRGTKMQNLYMKESTNEINRYGQKGG